MTKNKKSWLNTPGKGTMAIPLYGIAAIIGLSIVGIGIIWAMAHAWYHFSVTARMTFAVVLLLLSQIGVAAAMFQEKQGSLIGEGVGAVHCLVVFVVMAMAEQSFYIGWDIPGYLAASAVLCLPAVYLLRSVGSAIIYSAAVLLWAALGGPVNAVGGAGFMWFLLLLIVPFYTLLVRHGDEVRLSIFSWVVTITVFAAFGLAARTEEYVPFLMLSALAVAIMLTGYSIDIRKAWGVPFRWFGRFAAAGSLLLSCIPASWDGIANIQGFHWAAMVVTIIMFAAIVVLLAKGVKKRFWGPIIYAGIPVLLVFETVLVRSALYSSVPLIASSLYLLGLGFYETAQGFKAGQSMHMKLGILILAGLVASFIIGATVSALVPLVAIIILALVFVQFRRSRGHRRAMAKRSAHRSKMKHTGTTVHKGRQRKNGIKKRRPAVPKHEEPLQNQDAAETADTVEDWMKDIHIPSSFQTPPPAAVQAPEVPEAADDSSVKAAAETVITKAEPKSLFVPPVFHNPDTIPTQTAATTSQEVEKQPKQQERMTSSPWKTMQTAPKREKHFTRSPWSQEGEDRK
jgi:hypothetical protein